MKGILLYTKETVRRSREGGQLVTLPEMNAWHVGDTVGMGVAIQLMGKSLCKVKKRRDCLQFNTICQLRAAVSYIYSTTSMAYAI